MKNHLFLFTLLFFQITSSFSQNKLSDTLFLQIDSIYGKAQSVYILKHPTAVHFKTKCDTPYVNSDHLQEKNVTFEHHKILVPWTNWIPLVQYKNKYYTYNPCDGLFDFSISMNDSSKIDGTGEGNYLSKIISYEKTDGSTYKVKTSTGQSTMATIIHILDKKRGIAVFEMTSPDFSTESDGTIYLLMIAADKMTTVPMIVNNCTVEKAREWTFDEIDFKALIK